MLLEEAVDALAVKPGGVYVDATFGRGGHSRLILRHLNEQGRLIALDRDPAAIAAGREIADPRLKLIHAVFGSLYAVLEAEGVERVDGVLLDLGVSSPAGRGGARLQFPIRCAARHAHGREPRYHGCAMARASGRIRNPGGYKKLWRRTVC